MTDSFSIPQQRIEVETEIKKSRFIAWSDLAESRDQAMAILADARARYPDARHHCWAYLIGSPNQPTTQAMSDDGEPSGTAGKPILNVLNHNDIGNVMIVVSRYFGGIKLGAGGLVRAYSQAALSALEAVPTSLFIPQLVLRIQCSYSQEANLRHWLDQYQGCVQASSYLEQVELDIRLPEQNLQQWKAFAEPSAISFQIID